MPSVCLSETEVDALVAAAVAEDEASTAEVDELLSPEALLRLEALQRHIVTFAPRWLLNLTLALALALALLLTPTLTPTPTLHM